MSSWRQRDDLIETVRLHAHVVLCAGRRAHKYLALCCCDSCTQIVDPAINERTRWLIDEMTSRRRDWEDAVAPLVACRNAGARLAALATERRQKERTAAARAAAGFDEGDEGEGGDSDDADGGRSETSLNDDASSVWTEARCVCCCCGCCLRCGQNTDTAHNPRPHNQLCGLDSSLCSIVNGLCRFNALSGSLLTQRTA